MGIGTFIAQTINQNAHHLFHAQTPKKCIFCGSSPTTKEHFWPDWLRNVIPKNGRKWEQLRVVENIETSDQAIRRKGGDIHDWTIRCVCAPCNNGWMSDLEKKIKPILILLLSGTVTRIDERSQSLMATWCTLKVMVAEFENPGHATTHHAQRKRMWRRKIPPKTGWRIWIGCYDRRNWKPDYINNIFYFSQKSQSDKKYIPVSRYNTQSVTFVIGRIFIHVIHSPDRALVNGWRFSGPAAGKLRQIWPVSGYSFPWPPFQILEDTDADFLAAQFQLSAKNSLLQF